ncbi:hypothetical protein HMPREF1647_01900 [Lancefieldella parvula DNF00906]|uniref:hypothetical protein n=1 Tax=Lancefieldella parvula TaxID=1382 RepID=UPI00050FDFA1|nr:hypothetical protein [Lancefieldella parvula]KGF14161.1 hypothetical protein HMPREF1647_01900 [Lancefieldella parvula DNF00906]MDU5528578.1 hypothetical protein [Atopobium sp.]
MKNLKVCIASSALAAALALAPASALAEGTAPAPTSTTGATATTTGVTPIPAPTREQLMDPTVNPYAPEDAYFLPDVTNPIPDGFMVGNADGVVIIDNGDGTVTVKGHWTPALDFDEVIEVEFVRIPDPTPAPTPDPTPAPTPDSEPAPAPEPEPAPSPAPTPEKKSTLPATGIADVVVPASVLAVSGLGFVAASRKVRK